MQGATAIPIWNICSDLTRTISYRCSLQLSKIRYASVCLSVWTERSIFSRPVDVEGPARPSAASLWVSLFFWSWGEDFRGALMKRPSGAWNAEVCPQATVELHLPNVSVAASAFSPKELRWFCKNVSILSMHNSFFLLLSVFYHLPLCVAQGVDTVPGCCSSRRIYLITEKCRSNQSESNSGLITIKVKPVYGKAGESQLLCLHASPKASWVVLQKANQSHCKCLQYRLC